MSDIRFSCVHCGKSIKVKTDLAGREGKCPGCGAKIRVPTVEDATLDWLGASQPVRVLSPVSAVTARAMVPSDVEEYELAAPVATGNKLIPCKTCGTSIAKNAKTCPKCGAPNEWRHPEVQRFIENYSRIQVPSACNFNWNAETVSGFASVNRGAGGVGMKLVIIAALVAMFLGGSIAGPIFMLIAGVMVFIGIALMLISMLGPHNPADSMVEFSMDFSGPTPRWTSNDDKFWSGVKAFFRIR